MLASSGVLWPSVCGPGLAPPASVSSRWLSQQLVEGPGAGGGEGQGWEALGSCLLLSSHCAWQIVLPCRQDTGGLRVQGVAGNPSRAPP